MRRAERERKRRLPGPEAKRNKGPGSSELEEGCSSSNCDDGRSAQAKADGQTARDDDAGDCVEVIPLPSGLCSDDWSSSSSSSSSYSNSESASESDSDSSHARPVALIVAAGAQDVRSCRAELASGPRLSGRSDPARRGRGRQHLVRKQTTSQIGQRGQMIELGKRAEQGKTGAQSASQAVNQSVTAAREEGSDLPSFPSAIHAGLGEQTGSSSPTSLEGKTRLSLSSREAAVSLPPRARHLPRSLFSTSALFNAQTYNFTSENIRSSSLAHEDRE